MKKVFHLMLLALLLAAIPCSAQAAPAAEKQAPAPESRLLGELEKLNLSPAQKQAVAGVLKATRTEGRKLADDANVAQQALLTTITKDPGNEAAVRNAHKAAAAAGEKAALFRAKVTAQIRAALSPDQIKQFEADFAAWTAKMDQKAQKARAAVDAWIDQNGK